jgi:hypothetical protein
MKRFFFVFSLPVFALLWANSARAIPTDILWSGTCLDCLFEGETPLPSPANAVLTVDDGFVTAFSYSSALYEFSASGENLYPFFFIPSGPLPGPADLFLIGNAEFTRYDGAPTTDGETSINTFLFGTLSSPAPIIIDNVVIAEQADWALCVDPVVNPDVTCLLLGGVVSNDFGGASTFSTAGVPEPASLALVGLGLLGFSGLRRYRKVH